MNSTNDLRPYYDHDTFNGGYSVIYKPGVGLIDIDRQVALTASLTSKIHRSGSSKLSSPNGLGIFGSNSGFEKMQKVYSIPNSSDKNYLYDLELQEYFDTNNFSEFFKNLMWNFFRSYCKVVLSQPLDIVRLVLQIGKFDFDNEKRSEKDISHNIASSGTFDSKQGSVSPDFYPSDEELNYFIGPEDSGNLRGPKSPLKSTTKSSFKKKKDTNKIQPVSLHTIDILFSIVAKDGPLALFKGINASFIYGTLSHTIEAWITGFLSPFLGIPDPFFLDLAHSTDPNKSLWLSISACILTGFILMPLDLIKVRLMITHFNKPIENSDRDPSESSQDIDNKLAKSQKKVNVRSIRDSLRNFPASFLTSPEPSIAVLTMLHQLSTTIFRKIAPYFMFVRFNIDAYQYPTLYTIANLISSIAEFFVKLPVENLLRKEQVRYLLRQESYKKDAYNVLTIVNPDKELIVDYNDDWYKEHDNKNNTTLSKIKRLGLFNGWRIGIMNVIGYWGYNIISQTGVQLREERL